MRKILAMCCLVGILLLSACAPGGQPTGTTTTTDATTTSTTESTTVSTDDTSWSDTTWSDDFTSVTVPSDDEDPEDTDNTDYGTTELVYKEVLPTHHEANLIDPQEGGADAEAEALKQEILNTVEGEYNITGTTYYISYKGSDFNDGLSPETAWRTPDAVTMNAYLIEEGDGILFERGGVYRRTSVIKTVSGVTYGAYGEGEKPAIYGSALNYAWGADWEPSRMKNVWKITLYAGDAGLIVFNHGEAIGDKKVNGLEELVENGDFFHNTDESTLYLYLDKGYPNVVYEDIEIGTAERVFTAPYGAHDVLIDNIAIKYAGYYGFDTRDEAVNISITNCEFGWIGGCVQENATAQLGNAIQLWESVENVTVENCWIYQVWDAGVSPQGISGSTYKDVVFRNNLIEYCAYTIEFFDRLPESIWDGFVIEDNILRFAGYGFSRDRSDDTASVAHLVGWSFNYDNIPGKGISIKNNIFDCSTKNLVYWYSASGVKPVFEQGNVTISGNSFYQKTNKSDQAMLFSDAGQKRATNQQELEEAIRPFDSTPKVVKWLS